MMGSCRFCGSSTEGEAFTNWVRPTFTDWDKLLPGDIICHACLFWFDEASKELTARTGKDKMQRMRNYSHFIVNGEWTPLSKGDKARMRGLLSGDTFPELAVIAESGQKHIAFRATRNPPNATSGWVQFEEQSIWVEPAALNALIILVERLYVTFSKTEIETGIYLPHRIMQFGLEAWRHDEHELRQWRGKPLFALSIFLAQRSDDDTGRTSQSSSDPAPTSVGGDGQRSEEPLPHDDLGTIRERDTERGVHEQSGKVYQLPLF